MTARLIDHEETLRRIVPGAGMYERPGLDAVTIGLHLEVTAAYPIVPDADYAQRTVTYMAEQLRTRAIRELGLEPILDAHRAEVRAYREANMRLSGIADMRAKRIAELEEALMCEDAGGGDEPL